MPLMSQNFHAFIILLTCWLDKTTMSTFIETINNLVCRKLKMYIFNIIMRLREISISNVVL